MLIESSREHFELLNETRVYWKQRSKLISFITFLSQLTSTNSKVLRWSCIKVVMGLKTSLGTTNLIYNVLTDYYYVLL